MTVRRIIPDVYTEYDDGRIGAVAPALANVEAKIGPADGGVPGQLYVLSGPDAKAQAKTIFQGGPLLRALEEAFDAGSSTIYAWRIGSAAPGTVELADNIGVPALRLAAANPNGTSGQIEVTVLRPVNQHIVGLYVIDTAAGRIKKVDTSGNVVAQVDYTGQTNDPRAVIMQFGGLNLEGFNDTWLLGVDFNGLPKLWHYDMTTGLVDADTVDLSNAIPAGEELTGLLMVSTYSNQEGIAILLTTDKAIYGFNDLNAAPVAPTSYVPFSQWGLANTNVQDASLSYPINDFSGMIPDAYYVADPTARVIHRLAISQTTVTTFDMSGIAGSESMRGMTFDPISRILYAAVGVGADARIIAFNPAVAAPAENDVLFSIAIGGTVTGLGFTPISVDPDVITDLNATISIRDTADANGNVYSFTGFGATQLANAINAGQTLVVATPLSNASPASTLAPVYLGGSTGGGAPTNGDYIAGLELTTGYPEISWVHPVGATSRALWVATLAHCRSMLDDHLSERFAILETAPFSSTASPSSAAYLADLQNYVNAIASQMALTADRNAVVFPGGAEFMGSDGNTYVGSVAAACGGVMAALSVQKSLINKQVPNVLKLVPEFTPGHLQQLIQARTNAVRRKPGRGFIIAHSLTAAAPGSDYSRVNDLRAVYYGAKQARLAAQPYVGEENDERGEGLQRLESAMSRPLEVMRDAPEPQIDDFDLRARSNANDRLIGDVYVELGIRPLRAMEIIYTTVFLK